LKKLGRNKHSSLFVRERTKRFLAVTPEEISERFKNSFEMRETKENLKREKKKLFLTASMENQVSAEDGDNSLLSNGACQPFHRSIEKVEHSEDV
jgi:hypothetical protein